MSAAKQSVVLVYSTSHAIRLESLLKAAGTGCKLIPVPRHLSSDCGVCLRFHDADRSLVDRILDQTGMEIQGVASVSP